LQVLPCVLVILIFGAWSVVRAAIPGSSAVRERSFRPPRQLVCLTVLLALLPYAAAVGTNSPFAEAMSHHAVLWLLAAVVGVRMVLGAANRPVANRAVSTMILVSLSVTAVVMVTALADDGRDRSLLAADESVPLLGGSLQFPPREAELARHLNAVAASEGITDDTPVVDLTGIAPGYAVQLGGVRLGRAFYMGVFPGGPEAAAYALSRATCEQRSRAWLLWAPNNKWDVSSKVDLDGRRIPVDFDVVTSFNPVQGPADWRPLQIQVLRPRGSNRACPGSDASRS
jgi:hypothetical protein